LVVGVLLYLRRIDQYYYYYDLIGIRKLLIIGIIKYTVYARIGRKYKPKRPHGLRHHKPTAPK